MGADWVYYVIVIVAALGSYYSAQRAQQGSRIKPGELQAPTASEGQKIPKLFGTRKIKAPNVVWYGRVWSSPIQK